MTKHEIYNGPDLSGLTKGERARLVQAANRRVPVAKSQRGSIKQVPEWPESKPRTLAEQQAQQS